MQNVGLADPFGVSFVSLGGSHQPQLHANHPWPGPTPVHQQNGVYPLSQAELAARSVLVLRPASLLSSTSRYISLNCAEFLVRFRS